MSDGEIQAGDVDADGNLQAEACTRICEAHGATDVTGCESTPSTDTGGEAFTLECEATYTVMCEGRRPPGFRPRRTGDVWLRRAELEAASIHAFLRLHRELTAHGAPPDLADRCLSAARDEVRHARDGPGRRSPGSAAAGASSPNPEP